MIAANLSSGGFASVTFEKGEEMATNGRQTVREDVPQPGTGAPRYQHGFGGEFESEAIPGALPRNNNPLHPPMGLCSELLTTTAFMAPREHNRRSYVFRIRPSAVQGRMRELDNRLIKTAPMLDALLPNQMRWAPLAIPETPQDFLDGLATICANGDTKLQAGMALHVYLANRSMERRYFACTDGELMIVPQQGELRVSTELGILELAPGELLLIPRGIRFRVEIMSATARGLVCENYGLPFRLPELGPLGATGLARKTDFQVPVAAYEDRDGHGPMQFVQKFGGRLWACELGHSPLDVVAWRGSTTPIKFNMANFMAIGSVSKDRADPSIFTALTSPSDAILGANADLRVISPQWVVGDDTFRTAPFHRNSACEFAAMIKGASPNKADGSGPGSMQIHNGHAPHGPDPGTLERTTSRDPTPFRLENMLMVAWETRFSVAVTEYAMSRPEFQANYADCWSGHTRRFQAR